jgi:hypothetical protein
MRRPSSSGLGVTLALALLVVGAGGCSQTTEDEDAPADGVAAISRSFPDLALETAGLLTLSEGGICSGTLIAPNVVVTAGHCLRSKPTAFYLGRGAAITTSEPASKALSVMKKHVVVDAVVFPSFDRARAFADNGASYYCDANTIDVGLVRLEQAVTSPAPTPIGDQPPLGTRCDTVSFGTFEDRETKRQTTHERRSVARLVDPSSVFRIQTNNLTAVTHPDDAGGGLFCHEKLVGVLSCGTHSADDHAALPILRGWISATSSEWAL